VPVPVRVGVSVRVSVRRRMSVVVIARVIERWRRSVSLSDRSGRVKRKRGRRVVRQCVAVATRIVGGVRM